MVDPTSNPPRRDVLQAGAAGIAAASLAGGARAAEERNAGGLPLRPFGRTNEMVPILALGGFHASVPEPEQDSIRLIRRAVDEGVTFLDNCWDYKDGVAEERMGKALAEGKLRDKVFLMTKCCGRDAREAQSNLEDSLKRLQTDHIDLWQFHEINYDNDPDLVFEAGGALEFALKAKEQGKVRYIGFTGHKLPDIHLRMLAKPYDWSSVQLPLNVMDGRFRSFQHEVLPTLNKRGIAAIGMKSLGGMGEIVKDAGVPVEDAIRYVLSLPITTLVSGIDSESVLEQNLKIVREFKPMSHDEMTGLEARFAKFAGDGRFEKFKTTQNYDGAVHQKQHGFMA